MPETVAASSAAGAEPVSSAGLLRRLAAMLYDALLVIALLMLATALVLPFTRGEAIAADSPGWLMLAYRTVLAVVVAGYFGICWMSSGQTLGSWRGRSVSCGRAGSGCAGAMWGCDSSRRSFPGWRRDWATCGCSSIVSG